MSYLFYLILLFEILTIIYNLIKYYIYIKRKKDIKYKDRNIIIDNCLHINVLIPCYKEIAIIKKTLKHFNKIIKSDSNIDLYVITTEKERFEDNNCQTTYDYLLTLDIFQKPNFHIINYPYHEGIMADQLNYGMISILESSKHQTDKEYFSIYNADSNPDESTFEEIINKIISYNYPKVIQQYSNYFLNYRLQNFLMKGFSIYQTAFEFRNGLINNHISPYLYSHVVGHGLTLRADYISTLGGFNSNFWCEDIYLTGLVSNNKEKIIPLESLDNAENPCKLSIQIIQNAVWFKTASQHFKILKEIKKEKNLSLNGYLWLFHELRATFVWAFMPIFLLYSLVYPCVLKNFTLSIISLLIYLIFVFFNYLLNMLIVNNKRFFKFLKDYFSVCIAILLTGIGPIYSLFLKEKIKTER